MKNIIRTILVVAVLLFSNSCSDEDLNPLLPIEAHIGLVRGEKIFPEETFIEIASEDDVVVHMNISSPNDDVDSYTLRGNVKLGADWTGYIDIKTYTEFPTEVIITARELAEAIGMSLEDIPNYSRFYFLGVSESGGYIVDLDVVIGHGFSPDDNPDGVVSGLTTAYIENKHILRFI